MMCIQLFALSIKQCFVHWTKLTTKRISLHLTTNMQANSDNETDMLDLLRVLSEMHIEVSSIQITHRAQ